MKVLIVKTSSMGDVVHALPVLSDIKANYSNCQIDWLVEEPFADIVKASSLVENVLYSNVRKWRKAPFSQQTLHEIAALRKTLKSAKYDLVIDLQGLFKSAILSKLSSSRIAGFDFLSARESGAAILYDKKYKVEKSKSAVKRCRELAAQALNYNLPRTDPFFEFGRISQSAFGQEEIASLLKSPQVVFFVNASRKTKLWREGYWIEVGTQIAKKGFQITLPWNSEEELQRVRRIALGIGDAAKILSHQSIGQLMRRISSSNLAVGLDTGMTHLSAAMGIPTVGLFLDYPIELVPLVGNGKKKALGGVNACPQCDDVLEAISEVLK